MVLFLDKIQKNGTNEKIHQHKKLQKMEEYAIILEVS